MTTLQFFVLAGGILLLGVMYCWLYSELQKEKLNTRRQVDARDDYLRQTEVELERLKAENEDMRIARDKYHVRLLERDRMYRDSIIIARNVLESVIDKKAFVDYVFRSVRDLVKTDIYWLRMQVNTDGPLIIDVTEREDVS